MIFHHVGIAVQNIDVYYNTILMPLFGFNKISEIIVNESQNVKVAFVRKDASTRFELIEAIDENSPTVKILKKENGGLYHLGFLSKNFDEDVRLLKKNKFILISYKERIAFFSSPSYEIYELIDFTLGWEI